MSAGVAMPNTKWTSREADLKNRGDCTHPKTTQVRRATSHRSRRRLHEGEGQPNNEGAWHKRSDRSSPWLQHGILRPREVDGALALSVGHGVHRRWPLEELLAALSGTSAASQCSARIEIIDLGMSSLCVGGGMLICSVSLQFYWVVSVGCPLSPDGGCGASEPESGFPLRRANGGAPAWALGGALTTAHSSGSRCRCSHADSITDTPRLLLAGTSQMPQ